MESKVQEAEISVKALMNSILVGNSQIILYIIFKIAVLPSFFLIAFLGENGYPLAGVMAVLLSGVYLWDWMKKT